MERDTSRAVSEMAEQAAFKQIVESMRGDGEVTEIALRDTRDKNKLLSLLASGGANIESFKTIEPTLHDIFVEYAGDELKTPGGGAQ
jgi:ABC-type uncharacterized transport system ATPase subunit